MKTIHAFTETHRTYPGYITINENDGRIIVCVRIRNSASASMIELNRDQLAAMHADVGAYLAATAPADPAPVVEPVKVDTKPEPKAAKDKA